MLQRLSSVPVGAFMRLACIELSCGAAMAGAPSRVAKGDAVRRGSGLLGTLWQVCKIALQLRQQALCACIALGAESGAFEAGCRVWVQKSLDPASTHAIVQEI